MLDKIIAFSIKNKLIVGLLTLALVVWGVWSALQLPIDAVPDITNNQVQIITTCPSLAGQEVEQLVTFPIEQSITNLPDLVELRSISRFGLSVITVVFKENVDVYFARQLISERLKEAEKNIPVGIGTPELAPVSTGLGEVYQYIIHPKEGSENKYSAMELRTMQDWIVARQLYGTPGIAEVNSFGGKLKQYEVSINPDRLQALDVSIAEVFAALENNNQNTGGAYIDKKPNAYFIRSVGLISSFEDIRNIVVKQNDNGIPILIKDLATVQLGHAVRYGAMTYNGEKDVVGGVIMMLKGANSAEVVNLIKAKMPAIQKSLPEDVVIEAFLDRRNLVDRAMATVEKNLVEGALIVIFVLVLFLGNMRAGLIVASAIPLSLLFALGLMHVFGVSANLMSLGAIDFGLIVDGAVIIVEATMHHLGLRKTIGRLTQKEMDEEVFTAASKIRSSAAFGEIIILIVYIPILTLVGIEGKMFSPMAQTVSFAIFGALILSLTYIPMMCALFLSKKAKQKLTWSDRMMEKLQRGYTPWLQRAINHKKAVIGSTVLVFALSVFAFSRMGGEFIPTLQEGDFAFHCILPQGTSLSQSVETSMHASRIIKEFDEVKMVVGKTGSAEVPTDPMPPEGTDMMIILKPRGEWQRSISYDDLGDEMLEALAIIPGAFFEKSQPIQMRFNELMTGIRQDVAVKVFGENLDSLAYYGNKINAIVQQIEGTTEPMVERISGLPQIVVRYNRAQIASYGLNIKDINTTISTAFAGEKAGVVYEDERRFDLVLRLDSANRTSITDVGRLFVTDANGLQIPLNQLAEVRQEMGASQISRDDGKRRIVVGFNIKDRDVESVVADIEERLDAEIKLPEGYYYTFGGTFENLKAASDRLMIAVPLALALIFLLLFFTFNSMKQAALIFTAIPMSAIGGVLALLLRDMPFSISAGIGFIALFGVAVLNGIVLIGTFNQLKKEGMSNSLDRVLEGCKIRLRPVLMTATVASLGFLPMALSTGAGAEVQKPLATVVIGGLISATFLTLFVLPLLYLVFDAAKKIKIAPALVLAFCLFGGAAQAQTKYLPEQVLAIALQNNLGLKADSLQVLAAQKTKNTSFYLPKTEVNMQYGQYNSIEKDLGFTVSQPIRFPTVYTANGALYEAQFQTATWAQKANENLVTMQVKSTCDHILHLLAEQKELQKLDSVFADFGLVADVRYSTGETNLLEKTTAQTKVFEVKMLLRQNDADLAQAYANLKTLMGISQPFELFATQNYDVMLLSVLPDTALIGRNPEVLMQYQKAIEAEKRKKTIVADAMPDLTIGYFNQSLIGFQNTSGTEVYYGSGDRFQGINVGVAVPLTIFSNVAEAKSAEYQKQALERAAEENKLKLQSQLQATVAKYNEQLAQYQFYAEVATIYTAALINTASLSFRNGEIGYIEYVSAIQNATNMRLSALNATNQLNQTIIYMNYLTYKQ